MNEINELRPLELPDEIAFQIYDKLLDLNEKVITSVS